MIVYKLGFKKIDEAQLKLTRWNRLVKGIPNRTGVPVKIPREAVVHRNQGKLVCYLPMVPQTQTGTNRETVGNSQGNLWKKTTEIVTHEPSGLSRESLLVKFPGGSEIIGPNPKVGS